MPITEYHPKWIYLKLQHVYTVMSLKPLNMFILNVIMLDSYGIIRKSGLEQYITLTSKFQRTEEIFCEKYNDYIKLLIIICAKDVIYQQRESGDQISLLDVKRFLL